VCNQNGRNSTYSGPTVGAQKLPSLLRRLRFLPDLILVQDDLVGRYENEGGLDLGPLGLGEAIDEGCGLGLGDEQRHLQGVFVADGFLCKDSGTAGLEDGRIC
jgi:hypothetical protein